MSFNDSRLSVQKCSFCACVYSILYMRGEQATQADGDRFDEVRSKQSLFARSHDSILQNPKYYGIV